MGSGEEHKTEGLPGMVGKSLIKPLQDQVGSWGHLSDLNPQAEVDHTQPGLCYPGL